MIGKSISHYKILEKIGEGGMGVVYKAEDTKLKRTVALKFLPPEFTRDIEAKARFSLEAQAASALDHNNICTIYEIDECEDGGIFIAMAYYSGQSVRQEIDRGPLRLEEAIDIASQTARGLAKAHDRAIVHRDIKPANILLTSDGIAKIVDFGLAKLSGTTRLTREGTTVGTVAYMSPEQARGAEVDHRADIWSLGVLLYEMITGQVPFKGDHEQAVIYSIMNKDPEPVTALRSGVPLELERIISKCIEKNPDHRYQTAGDLSADLSRLKQSISLKPSPSGLAATRAHVRRFNRWFFAGAVIIAVVAAVLIYMRSLRPRSGKPVSALKMLVVLPFENLGPSADQYFANGITDAITARLAGLHGLGVVSRQSAIQYKGSGKGVREIREELGVDYILEGTVQRERPGEPTSRVRIIPQLIRASDDTHLWADTYDEDMTEVFQVQSSVAERVALELKVKLLQPERRALEAKPTENLEAYEYYLRGKDYWDRRWHKEDVTEAVRMYGKAVELDPDFAAAWAALSIADLFLFWGWDEADALSNARQAADEALELGPDLPETHLALGFLYYYGSRDYEKALAHFTEALNRRPSEPEAEEAMGLILRRQGKWEDALRHFDNALRMNPRSFILNSDALAGTYWTLRRYDEAERYLNRAISLAPDIAAVYMEKAFIYLMKDGDVERANEILKEAIRRRNVRSADLVAIGPLMRILSGTFAVITDSLRLETFEPGSPFDVATLYMAKAELCVQRDQDELASVFYDSVLAYLEPVVRSGRVSPGLPFFRAYLGLAYAGLGLKDEAIREGEKAVKLLPVSMDAMDGPGIVEMLAEIYAMTGEKEAAIDQLEALLGMPSVLSVPLLRLDPIWDPLRDHPRFEQLLEKHAEM